MGSGHGGKRDGAGRKAKPDPALLGPATHPGPVSAVDRAFYGRVIDLLDKPPTEEEKNSLNLQRWRGLADSTDPRIKLDTLKYLYDHRDGKAIQPVDVDASVGGNLTIVMDMPRRPVRPDASRR